MKNRRYKISRLSAFAGLMTLGLGVMPSCSDDSLIDGISGSDTMSEGIVSLDFEVPFGDLRTRGADALGNTDVNNLWVGVYDITTGNRVGANFFAGSSTGSIKLPIVYYDAHPTVVVVGVANYEGAKDYANTDLEALLDGADTWESFLNINVATPEVNGHYAVDPNAPQVMMGLLTEATSKRPFFTLGSNNGVGVSNASGYNKNLLANKDQQYGTIVHEFTLGKIYLQRLYSQVNVSVQAGDGVEVSDVSYRRVHMPKAVYLAERPMWTGSIKTWNNFKAGTPNFADTQLNPGGTYMTNTGDYYDSDSEDEWTAANSDNSFSFAHLENKHWAPQEVNVAGLTGHDQREAFSDKENKVVAGLGSYYNNQASYYVVRMNVLDQKNHRSGQVEYTIHEGFINDANGEAASAPTKNGDYASFRNMIYNYTITVNGLNYINYNVEAEDGAHHDGASGTIWDAKILNLGANNEGQIDVTPADDLVVRFYVGRGDNEEPLDFISGQADNTAGMYWPAVTRSTEDEEWFDTYFAIAKAGSPLTLAQFLDDARSDGGSYTVTFKPENANVKRRNPNAYRMGLYFYSPSQVGNEMTDADGCTSMSGKEFYVLEWKPSLLEPIKLATPDASTTKSTKRFINNNLSLEFASEVNASSNSQFVYGVDYIYEVKVDGQTYTVPVSDYKLSIPISKLTSADSYTYTMQAVAVDKENFIDSDVKASNSGAITLGYPNWDFSTTNWTNEFKKWGSIISNQYYEFTDARKENIVDKLTLYSSGTGKKIRGYTSGTPHLQFQNSGPGCDAIFTLYQDCVMSIKVDNASGSRELNVKYTDINGEEVIRTEPVTSSTTLKFEVKLDEGEGSRQYTVYSKGTVNIYSIVLAKP